MAADPPAHAPAQTKAAQTHEKIKQSARTIEASQLQQVDSADRRTELAADRTVLAAERTYAAWVRTGLTALASGIGARALLTEVVPVWLAAATGAILILFAAFEVRHKIVRIIVWTMGAVLAVLIVPGMLAPILPNWC